MKFKLTLIAALAAFAIAALGQTTMPIQPGEAFCYGTACYQIGTSSPLTMTVSNANSTPITVVLTVGNSFCVGSYCYTVTATNNVVWLAISTESTTTGTTVTTTTTPAPSTDIYSSIGSVLGNLGLSSNPSNYAAAVFGGRSFSKSQWSAGVVVIENVTANGGVGVVAGIDHLWGGGKVGSANIVAGGITLKAPTHPLTFLSSDTNSWTHKFTATPYVLAMVATPISGTGDANGGLGSITRVGLNFDIYSIKGWKLGAGVDYGKRTGAGNYSGDWGDLCLNIREGF